MADVRRNPLRRVSNRRQLAFAGSEKTGPQQQILGWITRQREFGKRNQLRAVMVARQRHQLAHTLAVARHRADRKVELGEGESH